jgi:hypothetical protein
MLFRWLAWVVMFHFIVLGLAFGETSAPVPTSTHVWAMKQTPSARTRSSQVGSPRPRLLDDALYASIAGYRALDYLSTRRVLRSGGRESELPQWVVGSPVAFVSFETIATLTEVSSSVWLIRHGHRGLARTMNLFSVGLGSAVVAHNYMQPLGSPR